MAKKITIVINKKGDIVFDFDGFSGKTCLRDAEQLLARLKELGVKTEVKEIQPKEDNRVQEAGGNSVETEG